MWIKFWAILVSWFFRIITPLNILSGYVHQWYIARLLTDEHSLNNRSQCHGENVTNCHKRQSLSISVSESTCNGKYYNLPVYDCESWRKSEEGISRSLTLVVCNAAHSRWFGLPGLLPIHVDEKLHSASSSYPHQSNSFSVGSLTYWTISFKSQFATA